MTRVEALEEALKALREVRKKNGVEDEMDEATEILLRLKKSLER